MRVEQNYLYDINQDMDHRCTQAFSYSLSNRVQPSTTNYTTTRVSATLFVLTRIILSKHKSQTTQFPTIPSAPHHIRHKLLTSKPPFRLESRTSQLYWPLLPTTQPHKPLPYLPLFSPNQIKSIIPSIPLHSFHGSSSNSHFPLIFINHSLI